MVSSKIATPPNSTEDDGERHVESTIREEVNQEIVEEINREEREKKNREEEQEENLNQREEEKSEDSDDEEQPMQPEGMFFGPSEYTKTCKVGSRCQVYKTLIFLKEFKEDLPWFEAHPQFKHVFHMPTEQHHMTQGLWMLLLRTAQTETDRECWFVVNGVPIRYSIKEHALLSGFECHEYPKEFQPNMEIKDEDLKFANRMFKKTSEIKIEEVEEKLKEMKNCGEKNKGNRKKLAILLFLWKVVVAKAKADGFIDRFFLRIVEDVHACETFPWGRFTFEECIKSIKSTVTNWNGKVKGQMTFGGFVIPLKILAFEAIPQLGEKFRESVRFKKECPRMCQGKFSKCSMRGFTLEEINEVLGDVKARVDICSILEPNYQEKDMLRRILKDDDVDEGIGFIDPVVDSWRTRLIKERKQIRWKDMYENDVRARRGELMEKKENLVPDLISVKAAMDKGFERILEKLGEHDKRIVSLEASVSLLSRQDKIYVHVPPSEANMNVNVNDPMVSHGENVDGSPFVEKTVDDVNDQEPMVSHGQNVDVPPAFVEQTVDDFNDQEPMVSHGENVDVPPFDDVDTSVVEACTDLVLYVEKDNEKETEAHEAVEGNHETPEKEMKKKETKKKEVKKKETKKQGEMIDKKKKRDEDADDDEKPDGKRVRKPSIHQKEPYTAEQNRGKKKKVVK